MSIGDTNANEKQTAAVCFAPQSNDYNVFAE